MPRETGRPEVPPPASRPRQLFPCSRLGAVDSCLAKHQAKYPKAIACLEKDRDELLAFYDFPAEHWQHLRTTNPIESTFATVRLRHRRTKGSGSRVARVATVFKLTEAAENATRWLTVPGAPWILNHMVDGFSAALDATFHALAHPTRRAMLAMLANGEEYTIGELAEPFDVSLAASSKHVIVLEKAKLVQRRVVGRTHACRINALPLRLASDWTEEFRAVWERNFSELDQVLGNPASQKCRRTNKTTRRKR